MSAMLLCRSRAVRTPYYAENLGIYLYSGEELSYYIYNNAMVIDESFINERLYRFIGQELGMENLEAKLRRWADLAELSELLLVILQDIHYYNMDELNAFRKEMEERSNMSPAQGLKAKGDYLLKLHRYGNAILQYDRILAGDAEELKDPVFRSAVLRSRGVAYARQYRYPQAAESLEEAWRLRQLNSTRRMLYQISRIDPAVPMAEDIFRRVSQEEKDRWDMELAQAKTQARFLGKGQEASQWMDKDKVRRAAGLAELTENWKTEYRRNQGC